MTGPLDPVRLCGATLVTGALLCALLVHHGDKAARSGSAADQQPAGPTTPAQRVERGKYLARAADCAACHTAPNGAPFAGGYRLESSFGTFYGTNITPDKENGIGKWSADDFYQALHDGVAPARHLYPAMPYTSYRGMSRADSNAIYAYLMQIKPVPVPNRQPKLSFPYSMRIALAGWNLLFLRNSLPDASSGQSPAWQRGRYLSNALGHCAECHTPRGLFGRLDGARPLAGAALSRIAAPDITPAGLAARGWTTADLQAFLATGIAPMGSAYGEMYPVVQFSTQYLRQEDRAAMATYLLGDQAPAPQPLRPHAASQAQLASGRRHYLAVCAGCHGLDGEGKPHVAVAMRGNSTVRNPDAGNLLISMLDGIDAQAFPGQERMQEMPGFAGTLNEAELAQLANFLRAAYGGQEPNLTAADVAALERKKESAP